MAPRKLRKMRGIGHLSAVTAAQTLNAAESVCRHAQKRRRISWTSIPLHPAAKIKNSRHETINDAGWATMSKPPFMSPIQTKAHRLPQCCLADRLCKRLFCRSCKMILALPAPRFSLMTMRKASPPQRRCAAAVMVKGVEALLTESHDDCSARHYGVESDTVIASLSDLFPGPELD